MITRTFDHRATTAYAGVRIRRFFFGPFSLILYALALLPFIQILRAHHDPVPLGVAIALLGFLLLIVHEFTVRKLLIDMPLPLDTTGNIAELLSWNMIRHLPGFRTIDALALLRASSASERSQFILGQIGIDAKTLIAAYIAGAETVAFETCLEWGLDACKELKAGVLDSTAILYAFFEHSPALHALLDREDLSFADLGKIMQCEVFHWYTRRRENILSPDSLVRVLGSFGRSWVMGYTSELDRLTTDIGESAVSRRRDAVIHQDSLEELMRMLGNASHRNVLILGKNGVGKRTFVDNFARKLRMYEIERGLPYTRILKLKTAQLLSGSGRSDTLLLHALERAQSSGRFILVIENIGQLLQAADANLKGVLAQFLQARAINVLGISGAEDYHSTIKREPMIDSQLEKIFLDDSGEDETLSVLMAQYFSLEHRRKLRITYKALQSISVLARRYVGHGGFPGKAIDIMNEAIVVASAQRSRIVTQDHIRAAVSQKAHINIQQMTDGERNKLLALSTVLMRSIIGQEEAVCSLTNALKRARLDIDTGNRPLGTFLFVGSTGVGKTETAKALAANYFGSSDSFVRIDLNEYITESSVGGIIGSTDGTGRFRESFLVQRIQDRPFSLILLDEIEKAHPHVLNVFLQILDEGFLIDARGIKTDFRNTIIIATSNAGGLFIRDTLKENPQIDRAQFKKTLIDTILKQGLFSPEFMNRFDEVLVFFPLTKEQATRLTILMLDHVIREFDEKKGIKISVDQDVVNVLAQKGYSVEFGARNMRRTITDVIENHIADYMLTHTVKRGGEILIRAADLHV